MPSPRSEEDTAHMSLLTNGNTQFCSRIPVISGCKMFQARGRGQSLYNPRAGNAAALERST